MKPQKTPMIPSRRSPRLLPCLAAFTGCLLLGLPASAQQKLPVPATAAPEKPVPGETVVLSPFEVSTARDTGFAAASSLAGGRLATDMRDTPVAYSVITREFIDALDIPDLQSAAEWATGSASVTNHGLANAFNTPVNYSTRGLSTLPDTRPQRNFFPQWNNGDSYNLERYDFGRGPNSILFGNGLMGGAGSSISKRAQTNRAFQTIQMSVGSWRNYRTTLDVNYPLNDKVAVRAAAVWGDSDGWRMRDFDKRKAAFLTTTFKPFRNTEIRLEGEYGTNARQSGFTDTNERFTGWDGKTTFNASQALKTLPANAPALGVNRLGANYFVFLPGKNAIMNYQNDPITRAGGSTPTTPIAGYTYGNNVSFVGSQPSLILHALDVPASRFDTAIANSAFRVPSEEFTMSPDGPVLTQRFKDLQLTISHRVGDNLFLEIAGDVNREISYVPGGEQYRGNADTFIDINQVLPSGEPNPNYLQPYADGRMGYSWRTADYNNLRAAVAYKKDTRFGNFAFNLMGGINLHTTSRNDRYASIAQGADHRLWGNLSNAVQMIRVRRYWYEKGRPVVDLGLRPIQFVDPVAGTTQTIQPIIAIDLNSQSGQATTIFNYRYALASVNAKFWKDRLVFLGAVRSDNYYNLSQQQIARGDYPLDWDGLHRIMRPDAPADWAKLTYFPRDATGAINGPAKEAAVRPRLADNSRNPLYLNDRFQNDYNAPASEGRKITKSVGTVLHLASWFNPSINYAETFNPPVVLPRMDGRLLDPTVATGTDYGLRMELFQNRLNLNFTYYKNKEVNGSTAELSNAGAFNVLYNANKVGDFSPGGRNIRGQGDLPTFYRDTLTKSSRGYEIEVVYNPTKALRLMGSFAYPKVYQSDLNPDVKAYVDKNGALFKQIANDAGVLIDPVTNIATVDQSIPINNQSPDVDAAAKAYNGIYADRKSIMEGTRLQQDNPIINMFADYTFQEGRLKRLRLGAGVRYRGKQVNDWRSADTIVDPANPTKAIDDPAVDGLTPVYTPSSWHTVTGNVGYSWKLKDQRELTANLVIDNLLNDRGPVYVSSYTGGGSAVRPKGGDYTSPARETIARLYAFKKPISFNFSLTLKM